MNAAKMTLSKLLDEFREKNQNSTVNETIHDLTACFLVGGNYALPENWDRLNGKTKVVLGYTVNNLIKQLKYEQNSSGEFIQALGKYKILYENNDFKVLSCLCIKSIKNTMFNEFYPIMQRENLDELFGFTRQTTDNIISYINNFNPNNDELFMFAGKKDTIEKRLKLQRIWLKQILQFGGRALSMLEADEKKLMKQVIHSELICKPTQELIQKFSYMHGKPHHTLESEEFLRRKIENFYK